MKKEADFLELFTVEKPIIGVVHSKSKADQEIQERTKEEAQIYNEHGVDVILMESYYGGYVQLEKALQYAASLDLPIPTGVNVLDVNPLGFHLANKCHLQFLQIDSIIGRIKPRDETSLQAFFDLYRVKTTVKLIGGVHSKYQPVLSEKSAEEDLKIAQQRCDAIAVTENATGGETSLGKIKLFRKQLPEFPLIVAAGLNDKSMKEQLAIRDAVIVESSFKNTGKDMGGTYAPYVDSSMRIVKELRGE